MNVIHPDGRLLLNMTGEPICILKGQQWGLSSTSSNEWLHNRSQLSEFWLLAHRVNITDMKIFQFKKILHLLFTLKSGYSDNLKPRVNIVPPSANQCMKRAWYPRAPKSHHNNRIHSSCVAAMAVAEVHHPLKLHSPPSCPSSLSVAPSLLPL